MKILKHHERRVTSEQFKELVSHYVSKHSDEFDYDNDLWIEARGIYMEARVNNRRAFAGLRWVFDTDDIRRMMQLIHSDIPDSVNPIRIVNPAGYSDQYLYWLASWDEEIESSKAFERG
jgi:hypothetical protein